MSRNRATLHVRQSHHYQPRLLSGMLELDVSCTYLARKQAIFLFALLTMDTIPGRIVDIFLRASVVEGPIFSPVMPETIPLRATLSIED